jgi:hypothetical protein
MSELLPADYIYPDARRVSRFRAMVPDDTNTMAIPCSPGFIPRALAHAASLLRDHPAALRVLCVISAHMDENGACRIRQRTIAQRLGISLQAANKQFRFLEEGGFLASTEIKIGLPKEYLLQLPNADLQPPEVAAYGGI